MIEIQDNLVKHLKCGCHLDWERIKKRAEPWGFFKCLKCGHKQHRPISKEPGIKKERIWYS